MSGLVGADPRCRHAESYSLLSILPADNSSQRPESARVHKKRRQTVMLGFVFFYKAIQVLRKQVELREKTDDK